MDSDDAVMALMGKHIADGEVPPVSFYGQHRLGSLLAHGFALLSLLFGFSIPILRVCALLFFLGFLVIQFSLLKRIFSIEFAFLVCLFLSLPLGDLMKISLDLAAGFSFMLFLGSLIIYLTYMVFYKERDHLIPFLAFTMGLAFWSHQMTIPFSLVAALFIFLRYKFRIKEYMPFGALFIVGAFPFFLYEIMTGFATSNILFSGEKFVMNPTKFSWTVKSTGYMMSSLYNISGVLLLIPILIGVAFTIFVSLKRRKLLADNMYALFLGTFLLIYFSSAYSNALRIRYLYPLYFSLPILYLYLFPYIKKTALRYIGLSILACVALLPNNINSYISHCKNAVVKTDQLEEAVAFLEKTGQKFWLSEYWNAYLMTALAKEDVLVVSYTNKKYRPYQLFYSLNREKTNYLFRLDKKEFAWQAGNLRRLLDRFNIKHKRKRLNLSQIRSLKNFLNSCSIRLKKPNPIGQFVSECKIHPNEEDSVFTSSSPMLGVSAQTSTGEREKYKSSSHSPRKKNPLRSSIWTMQEFRSQSHIQNSIKIGSPALSPAERKTSCICPESVP
jgi:hypothetical protein